MAKNWFGIGRTTLYGEYLQQRNFAYATQAFTVSTAGCAAVTYSSTCNFGNGATATRPAQLDGDQMRTWGLGINQELEAAAMDLYLNYRTHHATDPNLPNGLKDIAVATTGARIKF